MLFRLRYSGLTIILTDLAWFNGFQALFEFGRFLLFFSLKVTIKSSYFIQQFKKIYWTDSFAAFCLTLSDLTGNLNRSSFQVDLHYILALSPPGCFVWHFTFAPLSHIVLPLMTLFVKSVKGKRTSCLAFKQHMIAWNLKMRPVCDFLWWAQIWRCSGTGPDHDQHSCEPWRVYTPTRSCSSISVMVTVTELLS